jgi:hypothetical protein
MNLTRRRIASVVILALALAGCNSGTDPEGTTPETGSSSTSVPLPGTEAFGLTEEEFTISVEGDRSHGRLRIRARVTAILEVGCG